MITLYIETNFFIGFAKNQEQEAEELVYSTSPEKMSLIEIVTPAICCMESLSVLEDERTRRNRFQVNLEREISELRGNTNSEYSVEIMKSLQNAKYNNEKMANDINIRLFEILEWAKNSVEFIQLKPDILSTSLENVLITDPTDNLILHCILDHAKTSLNKQKVLLSGNSKDFGTKEIKGILQEAGIQRYFVKSGDFLGWLNSQF